ncbi:hypothetical protein MRX96_040338 [Rhipicephalus microplus]
MGRACRIVNEPPPTGCNEAALLATALLLTLLTDYTLLEEDSEESDEESWENNRQNGYDGRKIGQPGRPPAPEARAPIATIEEIDCFDGDIQHRQDSASSAAPYTGPALRGPRGKASNSHQRQSRDAPTAANSGTVKEILERQCIQQRVSRISCVLL